MGSTPRKLLRLSTKERELFALLPKKGQRVTTDALVKAFYNGDQREPFNSRKVIVNRMATIMRKREANGDRPRLCKSERAGPRSIEFWLET